MDRPEKHRPLRIVEGSSVYRDHGVQLSLSSSRVPGAALISVEGELDAASMPRFEAFIRRAWRPHAERVVFDLSQVPYLDGAALQVLLDTYLMAQPHGGSVHLAALQEQPGRVIELTQVDRYLRMHTTVEEAVETALTDSWTNA